MTAGSALRIGVVLEAFGDWPLEQVMGWLRENAPCAARYGIPAAYTDWRELVAHPLDAVPEFGPNGAWCHSR